MTITASTDYPSNINTLERMLFHNVLALQATNGTASFNLDNGLNSVCPYVTINMGKAADKRLFAQVVLYIPVDDNFYVDNSIRPWMHALEVSNNAYPVAYRGT